MATHHIDKFHELANTLDRDQLMSVRASLLIRLACKTNGPIMLIDSFHQILRETMEQFLSGTLRAEVVITD